MNISVLIVDDFPLVREGIALALEVDPAIDVAGSAGTGSEALERALELLPDVVLLDLRLPDTDGLGLIEPLRALVAGVRIVVISAIETTETARAVEAAGAVGYLPKGVGAAELRDAVITVFGGGTVFAHSRSADPLGDGRSVGAPKDSQPLLTNREREVLALIAHGHTDGEIAKRLWVSPRTVQSHLVGIGRKTGLRRRSALSSWAVKHAFE